MPSSRAANMPNLAQSHLTRLAVASIISWRQNDMLHSISPLEQGVFFFFCLVSHLYYESCPMHMNVCRCDTMTNEGESYCTELCDFLTSSCKTACGSVSVTTTKICLPGCLPHSPHNFFETIQFAWSSSA